MTANFQDNDNLVVAREETTYKSTYADLKDSLDRDGIGGGGEVNAPIIGSINFAEEDITGDRFSGESFTTTVDMFNPGNPTAQKEFRYFVESSFLGVAETSPLATAATNEYTFTDTTNLDQLSTGTVLFSPVIANDQSIGKPTGVSDGVEAGFQVWAAAGGTYTNYNNQYSWSWWVPTVDKQYMISSSISEDQNSYYWTDGLTKQSFKFNNGDTKTAVDTPPCIDVTTGSAVAQTKSSFEQPFVSQNAGPFIPIGNVAGSSGQTPFQNGSVIAGDKLWNYNDSQLYYSSNLGQSWTTLSNPMYNNGLNKVNVAITCRDHSILIGYATNTGQPRTYKFNSRTADGSSASDYTQISSPFSYTGPNQIQIYEYPDAEDGFIYFADDYTNGGYWYSIDQCITWNNMWSEGVDGSLFTITTKKNAVAYDKNTGFFYWSSGDAPGQFFQSAGIGKPWMSLGVVGISVNTKQTVWSGYAYFSNTNNHLTLGSVSDSGTRQPLYYPGTPTWQKLEQILTFDSGVDLSFLKPGDRLTQNPDGGSLYRNYEAIGVVQATPIGTQLTIYSTDTAGYIKTKFEPGQDIFYCPTQATFGVTTVDGDKVIGSADALTWRPDDYLGYVFHTDPIQLENAKRYLCVTPGGDVTGFCSVSEPIRTYQDANTISFPLLSPTGESWDTELPAGTSISVEVAADNTAGGGGRDPFQGYYTESLTPGGSVTLSSDDVLSQELRFLSFDYRTEVHKQDLVARRDEIVAKLVTAGGSAQAIEDLI